MFSTAIVISLNIPLMMCSRDLFCENLYFARGKVEMEKLMKAVITAVMFFFIALGLVIGSRMDQNTITLLGGITIGLLIAAPCSDIVTYLALRNRDEQSYRQSRHYNQPPQNPPQNWVMQQSPNAPQPQQHHNTSPLSQPTEAFTLPPRRKFYLIGESGDTSEIQPDTGTSNGYLP